jgi:small-conductance mechanosensitive channel
MKKLQIIILVSLFLFSAELFSTDINSTIVDGNKTSYSAILKTISKTKKSSDEINLQKTLLEKLIKFSKQTSLKSDAVVLPEYQSQYLQLFSRYMQDLLQKEMLLQTLQRNNDKLATLKTQINTQTKPLLTTQLFYAFYTKSMNENKKRVTLLEKELSTIEKAFEKSLSNITFDIKRVKSNLRSINNKLAETERRLEVLAIQKERYTLLNEKSLLKNLLAKEAELRAGEEELKQEKIGLLFLEFSNALQVKDKNAFLIHKDIIKDLKNDKEKYHTLSSSLDKLLTDMEKKRMGRVATFKEKGFEEVQIQVENLWHISNAPIFFINKTPVSSFKIFIALLIFVIGYFIGKFYKSSLKRFSSNKKLNLSTLKIVSNLGSYTIFLITFFIVLKVLGIDLSSIALVAGALSVGIGFGLQNIISNFVSGIIIMVEHSVKIGDYIQLDDALRGHVTDIRMRSITINTNSNIDVIVPNQELIQNRVINWTMNDKIRRFEIPFDVAYGTDAKKVIDIVLAAVKESNYPDIYVSDKRHTRVVMTGMGDSSVNFELFVWIIGDNVLFPKRTTSRFLILIYETLNANGIEIPFPQQDLHIRSITATMPVKIEKD